tara:strand:+ start:123 stop:227 length:105 start_codon:yes stop_codon:yes gene_type:complete
LLVAAVALVKEKLAAVAVAVLEIFQVLLTELQFQ